MKSWEKSVVNFIVSQKEFIFMTAITFFAMMVRFALKDFVSGDMVGFLIPWMDEFYDKGFLALGEQVGDYNLPYQFLIYVLSLASGDCVYKVKLLSVFFDVCLAFEVMWFIKQLRGVDDLGYQELIGYTVTLFLPTVFLNSAAWGQCDGIYTFFVISAVRNIIFDRPKRGFFLYGVAISFKLQSIFALPFILILWLKEKRFSITNLLYTVLGVYIPSVPAIIAGRGFFAPISVYMHQTNEYPYMWLNFPSFWTLVAPETPSSQFLGSNYQYLKMPAIYITMALLGGILLYVLYKNPGRENPRMNLILLCQSVLVSITFLPGMHERYSYLLEICFIVLAVAVPKMTPLALMVWIVGAISSGHYLFGVYYNIKICAIVYLFVLVCLFYFYIGGNKNGRLEKL